MSVNFGTVSHRIEGIVRNQIPKSKAELAVNIAKILVKTTIQLSCGVRYRPSK